MTHNGGSSFGGTVFKISQGGAFSSLYSFCSGGGTCGYFPEAGLIEALDGDFYGTTYAGGTNDGGTVFRVTPTGTLTTLYSFCSQSNCTDGGQPWGLVQATDGNLYGTTQIGGTYSLELGSSGTVYEITPAGVLTTLHRFCPQSGCADGKYPEAGLIQATNGELYGTTTYGGSSDTGTVFSLSVGLGPLVKTQPASGAVGSAIEILGTDLTGATSVTFNGKVAAFKVISRTLIGTTVPAGATTGPVHVMTPNGTLSSYPPFRVLP
jgi:uncharacterized repeat protein (TIGR03803 family)